MKVLENGKLVEKEVEINQNYQEVKSNDPLDRIKITDSTKKELGILLQKLPEIRPVIDILIGKKEREKLEYVSN